MTSVQEIRRLLKEYIDVINEKREKLRLKIQLGSIKLTEDRAKLLHQLHYYVRDSDSIAIERRDDALVIGRITLSNLLKNIAEYTENKEIYDKKVEMLKLADEQLYEEVKKALETLQLVIELMRRMGMDPESIAKHILS